MALKINNPKYGNIFVAADTFAELRSVSSRHIKDGYSAIVAGDLIPGDGFGGMMVWSATSASPDDSRTVIAPQDSKAGRWIKIAVGEVGQAGPSGPQGQGLAQVMAPTGSSLVGYKGRTVAQKLDGQALTPEDFGATGYATSELALSGIDATMACQQMATAAAGLNLAVNGNGRWYKVSTVSWPSGSYVQNLKCVVPASTADSGPFYIDGQSELKQNITFIDCEVNGNRAQQTNLTSSGGDGQRAGFKLFGRMANIALIRPKAHYCGTEGIFVWTGAILPTGPDDIFVNGLQVIDADVQWSGRHGLSITSHRKTIVRGGIYTNNGKDLPGYNAGIYTDAGYGRRLPGTLAGGLYGRGITHEGFYNGEHYDDWIIDGVNCVGNIGGPLFYAVMFAGADARPHKNIRVLNSSFDDPTGGNGDGSMVFYAVDSTRVPYAKSDAFNGITISNCKFGRNYINLNCANDVAIMASEALIDGSISSYSVIYALCENVKVADVKSVKPQLGRPKVISLKTPTLPGGWTTTGLTLSDPSDLPGSRYFYTLSGSITPTGAGTYKITLPYTVGFVVRTYSASAQNNNSGAPMPIIARAGNNGLNETDLFITLANTDAFNINVAFEITPAP